MKDAISERVKSLNLALGQPELVPQVERVVEVLIRAARKGDTVFAFGNGGNAANAEQLVTELIARYCYDRGPVPAITLTAAGPFTAINNDYGYENGFARQVQALVRPDDVVVGYSTSGDSANVLEAVRVAGEIGATTVGFSGQVGRLKELVDLPVVVASSFTPTIEETHLILTHLICGRVEEALFGETGVRIRTPERLAEGGDG